MRYYFHLIDHVVIYDHVGVDLDNDTAARKEAERQLADARRSQIGANGQRLHVSVTSDTGRPLFRVGADD